MKSKSPKSPPPAPRSRSNYLRVLRIVLMAIVVGYLIYTGQFGEKKPAPQNPIPQVEAPSESGPPKSLVRNQTIRDEEGDVIFRGDVDLAPTISRIRRDNELDTFPNDGERFENREGRLPDKSSDYYREWIHPTPKHRGPGPQRVVTGKSGEIYYTPDHYKSFQKIGD